MDRLRWVRVIGPLNGPVSFMIAGSVGDSMFKRSPCSSGWRRGVNPPWPIADSPRDIEHPRSVLACNRDAVVFPPAPVTGPAGNLDGCKTSRRLIFSTIYVEMPGC